MPADKSATVADEVTGRIRRVLQAVVERDERYWLEGRCVRWGRVEADLVAEMGECLPFASGVPDEVVEIACRAFYNRNLSPIQWTWDVLVERGDVRVAWMRADMRAALEALARWTTVGEDDAG